jgi:hypothetical protein
MPQYVQSCFLLKVKSVSRQLEIVEYREICNLVTKLETIILLLRLRTL